MTQGGLRVQSTPVEQMRFGRRLRQIRHARGKSVTVIAGLAGISPSYLSCLENGIRPLYKVPLLVRLADALGVPARDLVLLALDDYLTHGGDWWQAENGSPRQGRCRACPVSLPMDERCAGECP